MTKNEPVQEFYFLEEEEINFIEGIRILEIGEIRTKLT